ncbi:hypothetical protein EDWATA_03279 [Edwardsiella tarda ATCC 23685]|uniref:Uncharacterized protein n=1 Tax=Edwardsiella tarda ATCC 23685 TaxID=500638 RepID=D4F924_EDWTA|nr:hypothetical protein EDWATA_03279 [Edwardsiella tarda ATCC 23685]
MKCIVMRHGMACRFWPRETLSNSLRRRRPSERVKCSTYLYYLSIP